MSAALFGIVNFTSILLIIGALVYSHMRLMKVQTDFDLTVQDNESKFEKVAKDANTLKTNLSEELSGKVADISTLHETRRKELSERVVKNEGERNKALTDTQTKIFQDYKKSLDTNMTTLTTNLNKNTGSLATDITTFDKSVDGNYASLKALSDKNYLPFDSGLKTTTTNFASLESSYNLLTQNAQNTSKKIDVINAGLDKSLPALFADHEDAIRQLAKFSASLDLIVKNLQTEVSNIGDGLKTHNTKARELQAIIDDLKNKITYEITQRLALQTKLNDIPKTYAQKVQIESLRMKLATTESNLVDLNQRLDSTITDLQNQIKRADQQNITQESTIKKVGDVLTTLQSGITSFQGQVNTVNNTQDDKIKAIDTALTSLKTKVTALANGTLSPSVVSSQQVQSLFDQYTALKQSIDTYQTDNKNKLTTASQDITNLKSKLATFETFSKDQYGILQKDIQTLVTNVKDATSNLATVNTDLSKKLTDTQSQITNVSKLIDNSEASTLVTTIQSKLDGIIKTVNDLNIKLASLPKSVWTINGATNISYTADVFVDGITKANKVQLGNKWVLSGVGDTQGNDAWLRVLGTNNDYYGGVAMANAWVGQEATLNRTSFMGGVSEHNPSRWGTYFNNSVDNKNYIRGDTELRGNTSSIGDVNVGRNANVQAKLFFGDPEFKTTPTTTNQTDPYFLEKISKDNNSHLRLTLLDEPDESFQIWGDACTAGKCDGPGSMKFKFTADGEAYYGKQLCIGSTCITEQDIKTFKTDPMKELKTSTILTSRHYSAIDSMIPNKTFTLLYRGSRDGLNSTAFHSRCNGIAPLYMVIKANTGYIATVYLTISYNNVSNYVSAASGSCWLNNLDNGSTVSTTRYYNTAAPQYTIYDHSSHGPTVGGGHDIYFPSNFSGGYSSPHSYSGYNTNTLFGSYNFSVVEMEIYKVT
jgi:chromosome segregation ATPase